MVLNLWFDYAFSMVAYNFQVVDFKPQHSACQHRKKPASGRLQHLTDGWA